MSKSKTLQIQRNLRRRLVVVAMAVLAVIGLLVTLLAEYGTIDAAAYAAKEAWHRGETSLSWTETEGTEAAVLENDRVRFVLDTATAHFTLTDRLTGAEYSSLPVAEDYPVTAQELAEYQSVIALAYLDTDAGEWMYMGSQEHSVKEQNFTVFYGEDRLRVVYRLGTVDTAYLVPVMLEKTFYETVILENTTSRGKRRLSRYYTLYEAAAPDEDYEEMKAQYPQLAEHDLYILNDTVTEGDYDKIHEYITAAGYTHGAYQKDMAALGGEVSAVEKQSGFTVAVDYSLCDDGVQVTVPLEELKVNREQDRLHSLILLNGLMGCTSAADNYYLVPDGSGAVLETDRTDACVYTQEMYGPDDNRKEEKQVQLTEQLMLPCYGMKRGAGGLLAVIEEADAAAQLTASLIGKNDGNNRLYASFVYCPYIRSSIGNDRGMEDVYLFAEEPLSRNPSVKFLLLEEGSYSDMARRYRRYLQETKQLPSTPITAGDLPLYADFIGAVQQQTNTLGFTHSRSIALSYVEEVQAITERLQGFGVQTVRLRMKGFGRDGLEGGMPDAFRLNTRLGSKTALRVLADTLTAGGGSLSLYTELSTVYRNRAFDGFDTHVDTVRTLDRKVGTLVSVYDAVTQQPAFSLGTGYLVTPRAYTRMASDLTDRLNEEYAHIFSDISWGQAGYRLYSDYNRRMEIDRTYAAGLLQEALAILAGEQERTVTVDYGFGYTLSTATHIVGMPLEASGFAAESYAVPFYQMVVHGVVSYSGCALNTTTSLTRRLLQCAEAGAAPYYTWMTESPLLLRDTKFDKIWYALCGADDVEQVAENYTTLNGLLRPVLSAQLTEHSRTGDVAISVYDNGHRVLVNYGIEAATVDGITVPAQGAVTVNGTTVVYAGSF